ncbi:MAG: integrase core domain-containing protein [Phycisphaerae bacterium]|nr:integrase core domain-containing protein [Phycisphaerae bacterium]
MRTRPWTMLLMMMAGWLNRHQQDVIEYLREENKILREKLGTKRIILNDNQRMRLARLGKRIGRKVLSEACSVFSPDTILMWHRKLIASKYDGSGNRKGGKKRITPELEDLIIMFARKNKTWGSRRIKGALKHLGFNICHTTIDKVLKRNGYNPSPDRDRKTLWAEFLRTHWESLAAIDFFTTEIYTWAGLTRYYVLVTIDYATRKVEVVGISHQPNGNWMKQMARNLTDPLSGFLRDKKYLIHDRDPLFTKEFRHILKDSGVKPIRTLPMAPHLNCMIERFVRSIKSECINRMLIFGERHLEYIVTEYMEHYNHERPHQGLDDEMIEPPPQGTGEIVCRERLGGLLKYYRRAA